MIGFYNVSVILTYIGMISSLTGITFALRGANGNPEFFRYAVLCLMFSGLCDMFDGKIARRIKRSDQEKEFGIQIDSLCDLICFGVFPAILVVAMNYGHKVLFIVSLFGAAMFTLGAVIRLGYFNVMENARQKVTDENRKYFQGLPVTSAALIFPFIYALDNVINSHLYTVYTVVMFITAFMFVWDIRVKKPGFREIIIMSILGVIIIVGILV